MSIATTCRKAIIDKGVLSAECLKVDKKTYVSSSISLDAFIGNVDGKFVWGSKGFSNSAQDVTIIDGVLHAKLKTLQTTGGKYVDAKFDLNPFITNNDGVLTAGTTGVTKPTTPSVTSATSTTTAATTTASTTATSVSSSYKSSSHFHSSTFRSQSHQYLIEDTCSNFQLKEGHCYHVDFKDAHGHVSHTHIELDKHIGNIDGQLQWGSGGFTKSCKSIVLDKHFFLVAECLTQARDGHKEHYKTSRLDLRKFLRILDGKLIVIEMEKKLSVLLSEVPWMKFKVVAEPDLTVFRSHPVVKEILIRIAESCVEHVTFEMQTKLTIAMEAAIIAITASAMKHVSTLMETICSDAVGHATACPSVTEAECLHIDKHHHGHHEGEHHKVNGAIHYAGGDGGIVKTVLKPLVNDTVVVKA